MKIFLATIWAGCIDASVMPLSEDDFDVLDQGVPDQRSMLQARWVPQFSLRAAARRRGWQVFESVCASANPGRAINDRFYQSLKDRIRSDFTKNGPFDAVGLTTSGITKTFQIADVERDLLRVFQDARKNGTVVGFFTNCHSHLDEHNLQLLDLIVSLKEYPHTDWSDRATELFALIERTKAGELRPVISVAKPGLVAIINTFEEPYVSILNDARAAEQKDPVASISILHGNLGVNTPHNELRVLVTTNNDQETGQVVAKDLAKKIFAARDSITPVYLSLGDLIEKLKASATTPFVIADYLDNPFGGAAGDSTLVIQRLFKSGITSICCGPIFDPMAVKIATSAGNGARLLIRIGGKISPQSGAPLDLDCEIVAVRRDVEQLQPYNGVDVRFPTGTCVHVKSGSDVDLIISDRRQQTFSPTLFTQFGIELKKKKCIVVKSKKEYELQFKALSNELFTVPSSIERSGDFRVGHAAFDFSKLPRPIWPLDVTEPLTV